MTKSFPSLITSILHIGSMVLPTELYPEFMNHIYTFCERLMIKLHYILCVMIRKPVVAGQFYSASSNPLKTEIEECFLDARGPGKLPEIRKKEGSLKGVVVPHAGYMYSGAIAAHSYLAVAENGFADTFVLIGPNHTGMGSGVSLFPNGEWETPFGKLPVEEAIVDLLAGGIIDLDENAHRYEHSIEVQLPFLQYIANKKTFSIVPI
ncbi:MAG TPA: AmmeMemoRadiSam system protein B, partial [Thermoplasmata archaeon]|nr:AmmeMemoRadiSam system protein B [Thermoplasmata archaeon]